MPNTILQTIGIDPEVIVSKADSAKVTLEQFTENLAKDPSTTLQNLLQDVIHFGIKLLAAIVIYIIGAWLIRRIKRSMSRMFEKRNTDKALASFVSSFTSIALTILLITITIGTLGVNTTSLAALLAAGGVAIGMAVSGTVENFAGGLMLLVFKPFKAGDYIDVQGYAGTVTAINIFSTSLITPDNRTIVIPNGALSNGNIDNYSRNPVRRVEWSISVEYGTDYKLCKDKLRELIAADPRILDSSTPDAADPFIVLSKLSDSSVVFLIRAWVKTPDYWQVFYDYNASVYEELPKAGISFPFPQLDVHVHDSNEAPTGMTGRG